MPMGTTSYLLRSMAAMTDAAESSETSCSPLRPPKRMPTRIFFMWSHFQGSRDSAQESAFASAGAWALSCVAMRRSLQLGLVLILVLPFAGQASPDSPGGPVHRELRLAGMEQPVEVLRDRWGVSHIYARNQHDLFFAQGYVAASDRLFQMELWKRTGQGRLAEVLGTSAVERDIKARLLRYRGDLQAEYDSYAPDAREILAAFTAGINAHIDGLQGKLPREFELAGFAPEHWRPEDCLSRNAA